MIDNNEFLLVIISIILFFIVGFRLDNKINSNVFNLTDRNIFNIIVTPILLIFVLISWIIYLKFIK